MTTHDTAFWPCWTCTGFQLDDCLLPAVHLDATYGYTLTPPVFQDDVPEWPGDLDV